MIPFRVEYTFAMAQMTDADPAPVHHVVVAVDVTISIAVPVHAISGTAAMEAVHGDIASKGWESTVWQQRRWDGAHIDWESARDLRVECLTTGE